MFRIAPFLVLFKIAPLYISRPTISTCLKLLTKGTVMGKIWTCLLSKVGQSWTLFIFILTSWYFADKYYSIKWTCITKKIYDIINSKKKILWGNWWTSHFFCENEQNLYNKALLMEVYNSEVFSDVLDFWIYNKLRVFKNAPPSLKVGQ